MENRKRVVILESEGIIALDLTATLRKMKWEVLGTFKDFPFMFNYISAEKPDLIIIDSSDYSVFEKIRTLTEIFKINVIYLTESPETDRLHLNSGKCALLKKPYQTKDILSAIKKCC